MSEARRATPQWSREFIESLPFAAPVSTRNGGAHKRIPTVIEEGLDEIPDLRARRLIEHLSVNCPNMDGFWSIDLDRIKERTGLPLTAQRAALESLQDLGWLRFEWITSRRLAAEIWLPWLTFHAHTRATQTDWLRTQIAKMPISPLRDLVARNLPGTSSSSPSASASASPHTDEAAAAVPRWLRDLVTDLRRQHGLGGMAFEEVATAVAGHGEGTVRDVVTRCAELAAKGDDKWPMRWACLFRNGTFAVARDQLPVAPKEDEVCLTQDEAREYARQHPQGWLPDGWRWNGKGDPVVDHPPNGYAARGETMLVKKS